MKKILLSVLVLVPVVFFLWNKHASKTGLNPKAVEFKMPTGGDFQIPSTLGLFNSSDKKGKVLFVFFGFALCPHICPMTLTNLDRMIQSLPADNQNKVEVLFISIDPERDTLESLQKHLNNFKSPMVAATDTHENLKAITALFGARYSRIRTGSSFFVDHTSQVFVINSRGEWVETLDYNVPAEEYRQALETADDKKPLAERQISLKNVSLLGENLNCDLASQTFCEISTIQNTYRIEMTPQPVQEAQPTTVTVHIKNSISTPLLLDFEGVEQDMGFIRPVLTGSGNTYQTSFELPVCELSEMQWRVRLVLESQNRERAALQFYMKTKRQ
ncbi:SCO family protein [Bdellovibrio bacteriovorus]|uniref:Sco1/SenC family protein n=1 Tax=Bdellovibrio bacteriovorus str. Tiberius TaxID=1069642 RepID=K7YQG5_BDEBC|nr:SCO family protein [Bdellovibrio bacteriovorus]AFY02101.1 Sco1/SenC family protein [Bdellovibrio bacteriovorus str. Tiberius]